MEFHLKGYKLKDKQIYNTDLQMRCEKIVGIETRQRPQEVMDYSVRCNFKSRAHDKC